MPWAPATPLPQRRKWPFFAFGLLVYLLLTAAVLLWYQDDVEQMAWMDREVFNHKIINQYQLSDNISQDMVIQRLGTPDITAAVQHDNAVYQLLYYRTHRNAADGITTTDECTALLFKQRRLLAKGDAAVQQYAAVSIDDN
ncbi:DUF3192 domain-containing protein [Rheinheimera maricola]|uniref:DUF3192 domain-containing protein n=1 Tax=Rheinheimera maricola TaxID=2793282 RepID=A0ABS7XBD3_9GAMM|nr:DUF3192 domain-containing protein [Rheinheimera maricola]MBZ9612865.1 DUF3192 domain-containing protein [Rheinheimera maricola]